jgi:hypothetical protein
MSISTAPKIIVILSAVKNLRIYCCLFYVSAVAIR